MTPEQLREWQATGEPHVLIDVREPSEHAAGAIAGAALIPLGQLAARVAEVPTGAPVVVYCRSGSRSARAAAILRGRGFDALNLVGGYEAWRRG